MTILIYCSVYKIDIEVWYGGLFPFLIRYSVVIYSFPTLSRDCSDALLLFQSVFISNDNDDCCHSVVFISILIPLMQYWWYIVTCCVIDDTSICSFTFWYWYWLLKFVVHLMILTVLLLFRDCLVTIVVHFLFDAIYFIRCIVVTLYLLTIFSPWLWLNGGWLTLGWLSAQCGCLAYGCIQPLLRRRLAARPEEVRPVTASYLHAAAITQYLGRETHSTRLWLAYIGGCGSTCSSITHIQSLQHCSKCPSETSVSSWPHCVSIIQHCLMLGYSVYSGVCVCVCHSLFGYCLVWSFIPETDYLFSISNQSAMTQRRAEMKCDRRKHRMRLAQTSWRIDIVFSHCGWAMKQKQSSEEEAIQCVILSIYGVYSIVVFSDRSKWLIQLIGGWLRNAAAETCNVRSDLHSLTTAGGWQCGCVLKL